MLKDEVVKYSVKTAVTVCGANFEGLIGGGRRRIGDFEILR